MKLKLLTTLILTAMMAMVRGLAADGGSEPNLRSLYQ